MPIRLDISAQTVYNRVEGRKVLIMNFKERVNRRLGAKYQGVIRDIEVESDLIDDCKYMIYFEDEFADNDLFGSCVPAKNLKEARMFAKDVYRDVKGE